MSSIESYIAETKDPAQTQLYALYRFVKNKLPLAEECISYNMPCFKIESHAIFYFAAYKNHIGLYPTSKPIDALKHKIHPLKHSKGAIQVPLNQGLPFLLIEELIDYRLRLIQK
jgi:uncharacterized protein YdhG (YjbR/CyaY superfamily)